MKKILLLLLSSILLFSCDSAKKAMQRGSYETACMMAIKKLQKKPSDEEHAKIFAVAYQKANQKNIDRIDYLKQSREQKAWDEVLRLYKTLARRQELAETVLQLRAGGRTINFEHINYNDQIIEAKNSAAYFHYNEGVRLMQGNREDARVAYQHFTKVKNYTNNYTDLEQRIREAHAKGMSTILIATINRTTANLSPDFMYDITNFGMQYIDDKWRKFYNQPTKKHYDYNAFIVLNSVQVGPNNIEKDKEIVKKKIRDGWKYELDSRGNVKKDSSGNDIKIPKYKIISCTLIKKKQSKYARIKAVIDIRDNQTQKVVTSIPITSGSSFSYVTSYANGNLKALDNDIRKTLGQSPIAFPSDQEMIAETQEDLKKKIMEALKRNRYAIK